MTIAKWCTNIIRFGFYFLFILVPLILTPWNYELFEYNKMMLTYGITVIILAAWIVKMFAQKEIKIARTPLDIPIIIFVVSQLVSSLFSMDPHVSWFGYYSRFNGGMFSIFAYVILFYAFVSNVVSGVFTKLMLGTASVVALYGVAEHFGIDKQLWVQDVQSRVFSTLGQPNWLAAYLVALIPLTLYFVVKKTPKHVFVSVGAGFLTLLFFIVTVFTRSRSGLLGLAVADIAFWILLFISTKDKKTIRIPLIAIHAAFAVVILFNGTYIDQVDRWVTVGGWINRLSRKTAPAPKPQAAPAGTMLDSGGTESGTIRKYVWEGAINAWKATTKNKLIGTGTETFAFAFYQYRPRQHNLTSEWDFLYNKAHNEYLNYLATTGVFGLGSYMLLIGMFVYWFIRYGRENTQNIALFAGWISILVTNFFGFSVVVIQLLFFLLPAIAFVHTEKLSYRTLDAQRYQKLLAFFLWAAPVCGAIVLVVLARFWKADTLYAAGYRAARTENLPQSQMLLSEAISLNPGEPVYHDELASTLGSLALSALNEKNATLAAQFAKQSLIENDTALKTSPKNVNFWKTRTKLYYSFSTFDPNLNGAAIQALERAQSLSPNDPKILYNLAILYGRGGKNDQAIALLQESKTLKPNYRDAYFGLYVFYIEEKKTDAARAELQEYLNKVDPNDRDFLDRLQKISQ